MSRTRIALLAVLTTLLVGLLGFGAVVACAPPWAGGTRGNSWGGMGPGGMGPGMMGYGLPGDGKRVTSLDEARARAQLFADRLGLQAGEVMQFSNGYYAELETTDGAKATEVLVDANTGAVGLEPGPAMMWNTSYGMHRRASAGGAQLSPEQARDVARAWLAQYRPDLQAGDAELFPGYYTLHTLRGDQIVGMLSVNATTGAVWYHTWHGEFVAISGD